MNIFLKKIMICLVILLGVNVANASTTTNNSDIQAMGFEYVDFDGQSVPVGKEVTIDQATQYVESKGYEFMNFIMKISKPITIVVMVICGLMAIISGLTPAKNGPAWIWAGVIAAICYVGIMFSPAILSLIINFFSIN